MFKDGSNANPEATRLMMKHVGSPLRKTPKLEWLEGRSLLSTMPFGGVGNWSTTAVAVRPQITPELLRSFDLVLLSDETLLTNAPTNAPPYGQWNASGPPSAAAGFPSGPNMPPAYASGDILARALVSYPTITPSGGISVDSTETTVRASSDLLHTDGYVSSLLFTSPATTATFAPRYLPAAVAVLAQRDDASGESTFRQEPSPPSAAEIARDSVEALYEVASTHAAEGRGPFADSYSHEIHENNGNYPGPPMFLPPGSWPGGDPGTMRAYSIQMGTRGKPDPNAMSGNNSDSPRGPREWLALNGPTLDSSSDPRVETISPAEPTVANDTSMSSEAASSLPISSVQGLMDRLTIGVGRAWTSGIRGFKSILSASIVPFGPTPSTDAAFESLPVDLEEASPKTFEAWVAPPTQGSDLFASSPIDDAGTLEMALDLFLNRLPEEEVDPSKAKDDREPSPWPAVWTVALVSIEVSRRWIGVGGSRGTFREKSKKAKASRSTGTLGKLAGRPGSWPSRFL